MSYSGIGMWGREIISRYFSVLLVFVFLILISAIASAGQEIRITSYGESGFGPAIYNDKVVWMDGVYAGIIHMRDLSTGKEIQITNELGSLPVIYDDRIVFVDSSIGGEKICIYNTSADDKTQAITLNLKSEGWKRNLAIYGDRIVWQVSYSNGNFASIYAYNLSTQNKTQITATDSNIGKVDIYGNRVVWQDCRNYDETWQKYDIYMYDFLTSNETRITTSGSASSPKIYSDRIVYMDWRSGNYSIYLYNISTSVETQLATSESDHPISAFYGDRIVWEDYRNGNYDIYMYNLSTSTETQITNDKSDQLKPVISGDRIVWQDYRNTGPSDYHNYCEIYMYDFSNKSVLPFASFINNITSGYGNVPLTVLFTDTSSGGIPTSWYWDFGDGINSRHAQTATHTFAESGTYNVSLTVSNAEGSSTLKKLNCVIVTPPQAPVADFFSPNVESGYGESVSTNETVLFIDNSTGSPTSWFWDFGDGATSAVQNPDHVYNEDGGYIATLTVKNEVGTDTISKNCYVMVDNEGGNPIHPENFSSNVTSGIAPLTVQFITGDHAYGWDWNFGDGMYSDNRNPVHTYSKPGKYTVKLHSYDVGGQNMITKYHYITVTDPNVPLADFSANITSGPAPLVVLFTDTSTGPASTSWLWDFGDGINSKHAMNATHTFANPGVYNVTLTVTNKEGNNTIQKSDYINVTT